MLKIRHFQPSDNEYEEICRVHNAEWADHPTTVDNIKWGDENWNAEYLFQRFVAELDGKMIAEGAYMQPFWSLKPGKFEFGWSLDPAYIDHCEAGQYLHEVFLTYVLAELAARNPRLLTTGTREDKQDRVKFLTKNDFEFQMRYPRSELELADFDFSRYAGLPDKVAQKGIEIRTLAELMESDPDWLVKIYDLCWELEQDVPSPDSPTRQPLDEWEKGLHGPNFLTTGWFIALDGAQYVGVSMLGKDDVDPEKMHTWLTGVVRSHRRMGIATAMKLRAFEFAKSRGTKMLDTGNEENNPMYDLNMQLGFKPKSAWCDYQKVLE